MMMGLMSILTASIIGGEVIFIWGYTGAAALIQRGAFLFLTVDFSWSSEGIESVGGVV
jgi:hypothetical protein